MTFWRLFGVFVASAALSAVLVKGILVIAPVIRLVDVPNERSLHIKPTPRGGGLAIVALSVVAATTSAFLAGSVTPASLAYLFGALLIAAVSMMDDIRSLPVGVRLLAQLIAAIVLGATIASQIPGLAGWLVGAIAIVWIAGMTNAYNFMDGIDGLAGLQGLIAGIAWAIVADIEGATWLSTISIVVAGSCLGFLIFNRPPAQIFMGDVGSAFLGFTFAFLTLAAASSAWAAIGGTLIVWPFLFDVVFTFLRRLVKRENVLVAHRSHLYQRLVLAGWAPTRVALLYAALAVSAAAVGVLVSTVQVTWLGLAGFGVLLAESVGLWRLVKIRELVGHRPAIPMSAPS